jgi:hypothetical protein
VTTWANGIYWLEKIATRPDGLWVVRNLTEGAKREVESMTVALEPDLLYPLLRGGDVRRWHAQSSAYLLMMQDSQTRRGLDPTLVQERYPKTWAYLKRFEKELRQRSGFQRYFTRKQGSQVIETGPFYSMFNVGEYTFAPWKVVWGRMGNRLDAAVISNAIPQETVSFVACNSEDEAHYIAALINSAAFQCAAYSYSQAGGKSFGSPHILENICIRQFNSLDKNHQELSELSRRAHAICASNSPTAEDVLREVEAAIDRAAARAWGLTDDELAALQTSLKELKE